MALVLLSLALKMKLTNFVTILLVCIYIAEGRTYGYGRRKKMVRSKFRKRINKPFIPHIKKDPCPKVPCTLEAIPLDCLEKTYLMHNGKKCPSCDKNICRSKTNRFDKPWGGKSGHKLPKEKVVDKPTKVVEVPVPVEVPVQVPVRVNVPVPVPIRDLPPSRLPTDSVGPLDVERPNLRNGPRRGLINPDPVAVVNSPPSDREFVNRLQFDRNNANLLQPPESVPVFQNQNPMLNANPLQPPFQQGLMNSNLWGSQQLPNPNMQNGGNLWLQNQMTAAQLQAQQRAMQFQGQQGWGQFQGQLAPVGGMAPNMAGAQGFPTWGMNPNPFVGGMQQQFPQTGLGMQPGMTGNIPAQTGFGMQPGMTGNIPAQTTQFLNQIPPVPGLNGNFQGQATSAANSWTATSGFGNTGQSSLLNQNNQGFFVDPVTNQPLPGNTNSLHGPVN